MGAGAPHPFQERHSRHRECRRRSRQGDRAALHVCVLPVELGSRRRLHHSSGRHDRPQGQVPDRKRKEVQMTPKKLSEAKEYVAPNHRACTTLRLFGAEAGVSKGIVAGVSHFLPGGGAGRDAAPPEKVYYVLEGELTVIVGGKETVLKKNDS